MNGPHIADHIHPPSAKTLIDVQLEMLSKEIDILTSTIRQQDDLSKHAKQWAILTWTAAVGAALGTPELRPFVGLTAAIPLVFWFVDTSHRVSERKCVWRMAVIQEFLNGPKLAESLAHGRIRGLRLMDPVSKSSATRYPQIDPTAEGGELYNRHNYRSYVRWSRVAFFDTVYILYVALMALSLIAGTGALLVAGAPQAEASGVRIEVR